MYSNLQMNGSKKSSDICLYGDRLQCAVFHYVSVLLSKVFLFVLFFVFFCVFFNEMGVV